MARPKPNGSTYYTLLGGQAPEIDDAVWVLRHATSPLIALRALGELRRRAVEAEHILVQEARKQGETWESIAEALSETRQAVHRRHAVASPAKRSPSS